MTNSVKGYTPLSPATIELMDKIKIHEERVMRCIDELTNDPKNDQRWLAIARTDLQKAYMSLIRSIAKPERIAILENDEEL